MMNKKIIDVCCGGRMFYFDKKDDEYVKSCSRKTKKKDLKELIERLADYSTKKLDSTVDEVKNLLGL